MCEERMESSMAKVAVGPSGEGERAREREGGQYILLTVSLKWHLAVTHARKRYEIVNIYTNLRNERDHPKEDRRTPIGRNQNLKEKRDTVS